MAQVIQVELRTDTTHTVTWLDAALKPKPGMALLCKASIGLSCWRCPGPFKSQLKRFLLKLPNRAKPLPFPPGRRD